MKKSRGDKPVGVIKIYTWKHHKETPCIAICMSNKQNCHCFSLFYKIGEQEGRTGPVGGVAQCKGGGDRKWAGG
jgi:hypothetical protein